MVRGVGLLRALAILRYIVFGNERENLEEWGCPHRSGAGCIEIEETDEIKGSIRAIGGGGVPKSETKRKLSISKHLSKLGRKGW